MSSGSTRRPRRTPLGPVAVVAGGVAVLLATLAVQDLSSGTPASADVEPAIADSPPATVAPLPLDAVRIVAASPSDESDRSAPGEAGWNDGRVTPPPTPETAVEGTAVEATSGSGTVSDLAARLGPRWSAIPAPLPPKSPPVAIDVTSLDLDGVPIQPVGLRPDGQLEIPDETAIGWYHLGSTAGRTGSTVLVAHVSWNDVPGPFAELRSVEPGEHVDVQLADGHTRRYQVVERALYGKLELPGERLWRRSGPETLVLVTCGGETTPDNDQFVENVVLYAVPVG